MGVNAWRWMLGIEALPALIYVLMVTGIPNSPRWLIMKRNDEASARKVLKQIDEDDDVENEIKAIRQSLETKKSDETGFFSGKYNFSILLAFLLAFFNQLSGIISSYTMLPVFLMKPA